MAGSLAGVGATRLAKPRVIGAQRSLCAKRFRQDAELALYEIVVLLAQRVVDPGALATRIHETGRTQDSEVTRCSRLIDPQRLLDVTHAKLAVRQQRDDPQSGLVAECPKRERQWPDIQIRSTRQHVTCISRSSHLSGALVWRRQR